MERKVCGDKCNYSKKPLFWAFDVLRGACVYVDLSALSGEGVVPSPFLWKESKFHFTNEEEIVILFFKSGWEVKGGQCAAFRIESGIL